MCVWLRVSAGFRRAGKYFDKRRHLEKERSKAQTILFLLRLRPRLYLWGSPFLIGCLRMWPFSFVCLFFNPSVEVVFRGWCVLGVFLLPAFARLGHECQDLLSPSDGMHARQDWTLVALSSKRVFRGNGIIIHGNYKGRFPSTGKPWGGSNPRRLITWDSKPNTLPV